MKSDIQLTAIWVANVLGLLLALLILLEQHGKNHTTHREMTYLNWMNCIAAISCALDPLIFACDGMTGRLPFLIVYAGNLWMFFSDILIGSLWVKLCLVHMIGYVNNFQHKLIRVVTVLGVVMLVINFFQPIVFGVDARNAYFRGPLYLVYSLIEFFYIIDGIVLYYRVRKKYRSLRFFPVWRFVVPFCIGTVIQLCIYGVSTIWPCCVISICGVLIGLQNEYVYTDQLTGLYNRNYFSVLRREIKDRKMWQVTAGMLDLNGFKQINDEFGHLEGDRALTAMGRILYQCVCPYGEAIRYAGDEFVLILFTQDEQQVRSCMETVYSRLEAWNVQNEAAYELSFSIGFHPCSLKETSLEDMLNAVDACMYKSKQQFYDSHPECDRRK